MKSSIRDRWLSRVLTERGVRTELGILRRKQHDAAWRDYRRAASLGNSQAQFYLAIHYATGLDGHGNNRLAVAWFRRAALQNEQLCSIVSDRDDASPDELVRLFGELYGTSWR